MSASKIEKRHRGGDTDGAHGHTMYKAREAGRGWWRGLRKNNWKGRRKSWWAWCLRSQASTDQFKRNWMEQQLYHSVIKIRTLLLKKLGLPLLLPNFEDLKKCILAAISVIWLWYTTQVWDKYFPESTWAMGHERHILSICKMTEITMIVHWRIHFDYLFIHNLDTEQYIFESVFFPLGSCCVLRGGRGHACQCCW